MGYTTDQIRSLKMEIMKARCIFIHGSDAFQRDKCFKEIIKMLNVSVNDGMQTYLFYGDDYSTKGKVGSIIDTLNMFSFDLSERIISIKYFEQLYKDDIPRIAQYCENPCPHSKLIIVSDKLDSRQIAIKTIIKHSLHLETKEIRYPKEMKEWLNSNLYDYQLELDEQTKNFFINFIELDAFTAHNELKKLEIYIGNRRKVTIEDIKNCTIYSKTYTFFDLSNAVGSKNKVEALKSVEFLIINGNSRTFGMIISFLCEFFLKLWKFQKWLQSGQTLYEILINSEIITEKTHDYRKKVMLEEHQKYLSNYNLRQIAHALKHLYICDSRAKLSMASEITLLTNLILML